MFSKKRELNNKLYLIAANELIINDNDQVDLGKYNLVSKVEFANVVRYNDIFDACMALGVKLIDKKTQESVWGNIYYKVLIPNSDSIKNLALEVLTAYRNLLDSSEEEKMNFINKIEDGKHLYKLDEYSDGFDGYFDDLGFSPFSNSRYLININGKVPNDSIDCINEYYNNVFGEDYLVLKRK